jgi:hypothetical protein
MKRFLLLKSLMVLSLLGGSIVSKGQAITTMGPRLLVDAPSSVAGLKKFTYSSSGTNSWARALDSTWQHVEIIRTSGDSLGCTNLNSYAGKWALIWRGNCQFGEKALYAQQKGAKGVIIINNVTGADPVGMAAGTSGAGVTIPVLMMSNPEGAALWNALGTSQQYISLTRWGFNKANDLAFVPTSPAPGPGTIALSQWTAGAPPPSYKYYTGSFIANTGTAAQTGVKVGTEITFTPTGGSATSVYKDTVSVSGTFNPIDSIFEALSSNVGTLTPTTKGRYNVNYTVWSSVADDNPNDNTWSLYFDVVDNILTKARLDANGNPMITGGVRPGTTTNYVWGPLLYVTKGGYQAKYVRFGFSDNDTSKHALTGQQATAYIWKWKDGDNGGTVDNFIQARELTLKGLAFKELTAADSPSKIFVATVGKPDGTAGVITLEDNTWYWVGADMDQNLFLSVDEGYNYYNRTNAAKAASINDFWCPIHLGSKSAMDGSPADTVRNIPFGYAGGAANSNNIDSTAFSSVDNTTTSIALELAPFQINVENVKEQPNQVSIFPNPATDVINVKLDLLANANKAYIRVIDAVGRRVATVTKENIQNETISISTKGLAAGNYYVVVIANGYGITKPFTVVNTQ